MEVFQTKLDLAPCLFSSLRGADETDERLNIFKRWQECPETILLGEK